MHKKKVLICGATGFIGRNIAESLLLKDDFEVYGTFHSSQPWHHEKVQMIKADLTRKEDVEKAVQGKDIIIQAAATTSGAHDIVNKPYYHVTDNAVMNSLIFRAAHDNNIQHVIFFSCTVMYPSSDIPLTESDFDPNREIHPLYYGAGWTKVYIEKMCEFFSRLKKTKYTVIRHSNIFGPYDKFDLKRSHVFGATVAKVMAASHGNIEVWGDGKTARDMLYVSDLVDFVERALSKQETAFELCNVGSGYAITVKDLVEKIISHAERDFIVKYDKSKPSINTRLSVNTSYSKKIFGWEPHVRLDDGIKKTLSWYQSHYS